MAPRTSAAGKCLALEVIGYRYGNHPFPCQHPPPVVRRATACVMSSRADNTTPMMGIIVLCAVLLVSVAVAGIRALALWLLADIPKSE
jgi:hypothetical protein